MTTSSAYETGAEDQHVGGSAIVAWCGEDQLLSSSVDYPVPGKTTLAHRPAHRIECPAICRDEITEGKVHTTADVCAA
jgi:hypothetical protein